MKSDYIHDIFTNRLIKSDDPVGSLDLLLKSGDVPPDEVATLSMIRPIIKLHPKDLDMLNKIIFSLDGSNSAESLGEYLFPRKQEEPYTGWFSFGSNQNIRSDPDKVLEQGGPGLEEIRHSVFQVYPLAAMRSIIRREKGFKLDNTVNDLVVHLLSQAVSEGQELKHDENLMGLYERNERLSFTYTSSLQKYFPEALRFAKVIRGLCCLVEDAEDVVFLYNAGYRTARRIATETEASFISTMLTEGLSQKKSLIAYNAARRLDCWNEHLWLSMLMDGRSEFVPIKPQDKAPDAMTSKSMSKPANNLTDAFRLEDWACEDCCSITSLSAYFVEIMGSLRDTKANSLSVESMLDVLSSRRPDLTKLQLTCANSQTLIPYIALTIEVLESFIRYKYEKSKASQGLEYKQISATGVADEHPDIAVVPYNTPQYTVQSRDDKDLLTEQPINSDPIVNTKLLPGQMFPLSDFPYSKNRNEIGQILSILGQDSSEVVRTFTCPESILARLRGDFGSDPVLSKKIKAGIDQVLERLAASETLGLMQSDFVAITGQTFYSEWLCNLINSMKGKTQEFTVESGCRWSSACLWGYKSQEEMLSLDTKSGLSWIDGQFLQRSGLDFQQLLALTKTRSFGHDLAIANINGSRELSESLDQLQLLSGASSPPLKPLTSEIAFNIQAFLRLQSKLGWSTQNLDATISCLRVAESVASSSGLSEVSLISTYTVKGIASIVELSKLVSIEPAQLLPLWDNIDTFGSDSLMHRKFLSPHMRRISPIFSPNDRGIYLTRNGLTVSLKDESHAICLALEWPSEHFASLCEAAKIDQTETKLTVETFSVLYRHTLMFQMVSVEAKDCVLFSQMTSLCMEEPFDGPAVTLMFVKRWRETFEIGWTLESLKENIKDFRTLSDKPLTDEECIPVLTALRQGMRGLKNIFPYLFAKTLSSPGQVVECAGRIFDSASAKSIIAYIEGTSSVSEMITYSSAGELSDEIRLSDQWPHTLVLIPDLGADGPRAKLTLSGVLTEKEFQLIRQTSIQPTTLEVIGRLMEATVAPRNMIRSRFESSTHLNRDALDMLAPRRDSGTSLSGSVDRMKDQSLLEIERMKQERRDAFVQLAAPFIIDSLLEAHVETVIGTMASSLDPSILRVILTDSVVVTGMDDGTTEIAMTTLKKLCDSTIKPTEPLDAYFVPTESDSFSFTFPKQSPGQDQDNIFCINYISVYAKRPLPLQAAKLYHLQASFPISDLYWSTSKSAPSNFTEDDLLPAQAVKLIKLAIRPIQRAVAFYKMHQLTPDEIRLFTITPNRSDRKAPVRFHMGAPRMADSLSLDKYLKLKETIRPQPDNGGLPALFGWLSSTQSPTLDAIADKLSACTGWARPRVLDALLEIYPAVETKQIVQDLGDLAQFSRLSNAMTLDQRIGRTVGIESQPRISTLFRMASSRYMCQPEEEAKVADELRAKLKPDQHATAEQGLRDGQRRALVAYLLQQDYVRQLGIIDATGLFEHFLIDVQMGPQLMTSRIKQAVSVVQLFVQRCLLGLEKDVDKSRIGREEWEAKRHYNLWVSNMKLFLYPENWLDPSLRDDKSQLFEKLEVSLMKKHLSSETFEQALKMYIHGLNEISHLDILAYVVDVPVQGTEVYHLFGRTRSSPYGFYYRTLTVIRPDTPGEIWTPWTKINIDVTMIETQWNGNRLRLNGAYLIPVIIGARLYLFIPHIVAKTSPPDMQTTPEYENMDFRDLAGRKAGSTKPQKMWEVTMGWTELIHGSWAPKRMATGSVNIIGDLPDPGSLQFPPRFDSDVSSPTMTLLVKSTENQIHGGFKFCKDQIVVLSEGEVKQQGLGDPYLPLGGSFQRVDTYFSLFMAVQFYVNNKRRNGPFLETPPPNLPFQNPSGNRRIIWTVACSRWDKVASSQVGSIEMDDGSTMSYLILRSEALFPVKKWEPYLDWSHGRRRPIKMDHGFSHKLMNACSERSNPVQHVYNILGNRDMMKDQWSDMGSMCSTFGGSSNEAQPSSAIYHELAQPTALYNWELGVHSVMLAVDRFFATKQFEEALRVARLVFDPTSEVSFEWGKGSAQSCWRFPPFQDIAIEIQKREKGKDKSKTGDYANFHNAMMERRSHGALVHATARGRPEAYMKWFVMKYAEILIADGDVYFRQGTLESIPLALQRYTEAEHILGPKPPQVPKLGEKKVATFASLNQADTEIELSPPFSPQLEKGASQSGLHEKAEPMTCHLRTTYFCIPLNPKFKQSRDLLAERLYNIRNSLDIQGMPVTYALIEPPIDPGALMLLDEQGHGMSEVTANVLGYNNSPLTRQRFELLLHRALELCSELQSLGERLLAATERKESEAFSAQRQRHTVAIQKMMLDIKQLQLDDAQKAMESLVLNRESQVSQLQFYLALIGEPPSRIPSPTTNWQDIVQEIDTPTKDDLRMSRYEKMEMDLTDAASALNLVATGIDDLIAPLYALPQIDTMGAPLGVGVSISVGGQNLGMAASAGSNYLKMLAMISGDEAGRASRKGQLTKQLQDRRMQANIHGQEIKSIDKQVELQKIRIQSARREIDMQRSSIQDAIQAEKWYRTKYTNAQLYSWMEKSLRDLYYQAYTLALSTAQKAESSLSFEQGRRVSIIRPGGYWDSSHHGLLAADHLQVDLKRLEAAHFGTRDHDFEISKNISLRQIDPYALLKLRLTGRTSFSFNERLFDMDFPGQYMRRIRSVVVSIPAVVGPYTDLNATLRLTNHQYRVTSSAANAADYMAQDADSFRADHVPISAISICHGSRDAGVFNLSFNGPKYMPFEGAGVISSWNLDLPTEIRKFDYDTISDVVVQIQYTAQEGGSLLRAAANEAVRKTSRAIKNQGTQDGYWAMFDLKNDFSNEWYMLAKRLTTEKKDASGRDIVSQMKLGNIKDRLPFWSRQQATLEVHDIVWVSKSSDIVQGISVQGLEKPDDSDIKKATLGDHTVMTWKNLHFDDLANWSLEVPFSSIQEETKCSLCWNKLTVTSLNCK
ncbi:toxin subunit [Fusarium coicis]|nr:toxin subunit [Fusarium coicis]